MHVVRALVGVDRLGQASPYPYLFAGMELDSSGLYHTQTRYHSPTFGRFLSADAGLPPNAFTYAGNDPVNAIDPSGMTAEFVAGAVGMSPAPYGAIGGTGANPEGGGLGGAVLAQSSGCPNGDFNIVIVPLNPQNLGWLDLIINFFEDLFGGGGQPRFIPPGDYRHVHYPAMSFITDSQADIQQFTPHQQQKSHAIEILEAIGVGVAVVGIAAAVIFAPEALPALVEAG
jgi:RHS repeat-associated protein